MKLYLSSIEIPTPDDLAQLVGKSLSDISVAIIPNAQDYYSERARAYKNKVFAETLEKLGLKAETVDLRDYDDADKLKSKLTDFDLIWARGGNTFCLRYEMRRSGFDAIIKDLLENGVVYGGDSAGAFVAGLAINGIESADIPDFSEEVINEGLSLIPFIVLPLVDNPEFADAAEEVQKVHGSLEIIELKDNQAVIFDEGHRVVEGA
jgi:dipeptidase E